ncbi:antitoxin Xre/MbcA/ParS toxin-binding domain-containing protein [Povalibacter sp.]|uniref:antitoxin Xre/MbcA/ParS toxin-binding domain-containing protein n=1 Tax=Povalibacter sp. TaxID=1962978 RepID=UPI002F3F5C96
MPTANAALFKTVAKDDALEFWKGNALDYGRLREFTGFGTEDIARMTGLSKNSVRFDERAPPEVQEHMAAIANICNLVFEFFDSDLKTKLWLQTPNPMLGYSRPLDLIRLGRHRKLLRFVTEALKDEAAARAVKAKQKA